MNAGVGYRFELYDEDHFADVFTGFEYKNGLFNDRVAFTHIGLARMPVNDPKAYVLSTEVIFGIPLTPAWSFRTSYYVEYINVQPTKVNNLTTRASVGLGYTF